MNLVCALYNNGMTQKECQMILADFWPANFWPISSPYCFPLTLKTGAIWKTKTVLPHHHSVDTLKVSNVEQGATMSTNYAKKVYQAFRPRLEAMVNSVGLSFQKLKYRTSTNTQ